jgi:hypothetical protein
MTNGAKPVASDVGATWQTLDFVQPRWTAGANRSGGISCRILDNERAGDGGVFGRRINIPFKADYTAVYFFYAEHWHGWDGGNDEGGGGGYYKHNWLQHNNTYGGGFNVVMPDFVQYDDGKPSSAIYTVFGGNDSANPEVTDANQPFRTWVIANRPSGIGRWDTNGWNSLECAYVGDPVNPTGASGYQYMGLYNAPNKRAINASIRSGPWNDGSTTRKYAEPYPLFLPGNAAHDPRLPYDRMNGMQFVGLMGNIGRHTVDRADVYVAVGPNCMKRFFIGDADTLAKCTTIIPCTIDSWSAGAVTIRPRQGAFTAISGKYLYWSDLNNNISLAGQFLAPSSASASAQASLNDH